MTKRARTNLRAAASRPQGEAADQAPVGHTAQRTGTNTTVPLDFHVWADVKGWCARQKAETGLSHDIGPVGAALYELLVGKETELEAFRQELASLVTQRLK